MKVQLLYSGGHVHTVETHKRDLVSDLIIGKGNGDRVYTLYDEEGEREVALIDLEQLQMAWEVFSE